MGKRACAVMELSDRGHRFPHHRLQRYTRSDRIPPTPGWVPSWPALGDGARCPVFVSSDHELFGSVQVILNRST
jgi:hypothetical protein